MLYRVSFNFILDEWNIFMVIIFRECIMYVLKFKKKKIFFIEML